MADNNQEKITDLNGDGRYFVPSSKIKVFPCAWRNADYDLESRINTEHNFTNLTGVNSTRSYIAYPAESSELTNKIVFYLSGYRFEITDLTGLPTDAFANIKFRDLTLGNNETTPVLDNLYTSMETNLDCSKDGDTTPNALKFFCGLCLTSGRAADGMSDNIHLTGTDGTIFGNSYLPEVEHGGGKKAIQICSNAHANGDDSIVIGSGSTIEQNGESSIIIGCGSSVSQENTLVLGNNIRAIKANQVILGNGGTIEKEINDDVAIVSNGDTIIGIKDNNTTIDSTNTYIKANGDNKITVEPSGIILNAGTEIKGLLSVNYNTEDYFVATCKEEKTADGETTQYVNIKVDASADFNKNVNINNSALCVAYGNNAEIKLDKTINFTTDIKDDKIINVTNGDLILNINEIDNNNKKTAVYIKEQVNSAFEYLVNINDLVKINNTVTTINTNINLGSNKTIDAGGSTINKMGTIIFGNNATELANAAMYIDTNNNEIKATTFWATSDRRAKENISEYKSQKSILDLPVYKYDYINGPKNQIGCMAQDLREICPEMVHEETNGMLSVDNSKVVYLLLNEVKKLRNELSKLKAK